MSGRLLMIPTVIAEDTQETTISPGAKTPFWSATTFSLKT